MSEKPKRKKSTVRHTRAIQRDRTKRPNTAAPDETVEARLEAIVHPATLNQVAHFHDLGAGLGRLDPGRTGAPYRTVARYRARPGPSI
jgi:hypothetical protein